MVTTQTLTPGQKAALTRAANKSRGNTLLEGPATAPEPGSVRLSGLVLALVISVMPRHLSLIFTAKGENGEPFPSGLATNERGLTELRWDSALNEHGECIPMGEVSVTITNRSARFAAEAGLLGLRLDKEIAKATEDSEDESFAFLASWLASHFRVAHVVVREQTGKETEHKRGAAYITTLRLCDSLAQKIRQDAEKAKQRQPSPKAA